MQEALNSCVSRDYYRQEIKAPGSFVVCPMSQLCKEALKAPHQNQAKR